MIFELTRVADEAFKFVLKASNGETILSSPAYERKAQALDAIAAVRSAVADESCFERLFDEGGRPYFALSAVSGERLGLSRLYEAEASREAMIMRARLDAPEAPVKELS